MPTDKLTNDYVRRIARNRIGEGRPFLLFSWDKEEMLVTASEPLSLIQWQEVVRQSQLHIQSLVATIERQSAKEGR